MRPYFSARPEKTSLFLEGSPSQNSGGSLRTRPIPHLRPANLSSPCPVGASPVPSLAPGTVPGHPPGGRQAETRSPCLANEETECE